MTSPQFVVHFMLFPLAVRFPMFLIRGLSGKYQAVLNLLRTGRVALL